MVKCEIPSFETAETYEKRRRLINVINANPNYHYVSGKLECVLDYINGLSKEKNERSLVKR